MNTLHLISHTHWDREWYLTFQQFRLQLVVLMDNLLELLKSDPDFKHFMLDGQTIVLDDYLQVRPEREAEIRTLVQQGRILIGPWHILPDEFLVGSESHIRNLLQGERTAQRFGSKMQIGYIPDPFGHIGQMPQILRGFGIDIACVQRGLDDQPCEFWWDAPDGSRVLLVYLRDGYGNAAELATSDPEKFLTQIVQIQDSLQPHSATKHLLLMHGTDHMRPPIDTSDAIRQANGRAPDFTIIHSTLPDYIQAIRPALSANPTSIPIIQGELRSSKRFHLLPGVLSTRMWIKQRNHACEQLLTNWAEPFSIWAEWIRNDTQQQGAPSAHQHPHLRQPSALVHQAWLLLMQCHPHDSICGCSIDQVHEEMRSRFDQVAQIGDEITRQSLDTLASLVDTRPTRASDPASDTILAMVVFNPAGTRRSDLASAEIHLPAHTQEITIVDDCGNQVSHQLETATGNNNAMQARLTWIANDLPELGYRTYWLYAKSSSDTEETPASKIPSLLKPLIPVVERFSHFSSKKHLQDAIPLSRPPHVIENEHLIVEASASNGTLTITDRHTGAVFSGGNRFLDGGDCGDEYNYAPPWCDTLETPKPKSIRIHRDAISQYLEISFELQTPASLSDDRSMRSSKKATIPITTWVALHRGIHRVEIRTNVENTALDHRLRVHFSLPFQCSEAWHDGHFEIVRRSVAPPPYDDTWAEQPRPEVPQRCFTGVCDDKIGLIVANRGLPEVEVLHTPHGNAELAITLLRCVGWLSRDDFSTREGHAGPMLAVPGAQEPGAHTFEYALVPFDVQSESSIPHHAAREYCAPPRAIVTGLHAGPMPTSSSMLSIRPITTTSDAAAESRNPIVLSAIKSAEHQPAWLTRIYNTSAQTQNAAITPWRPFSKIWRSNLAEQTIEPLQTQENGQINISMRGHEILTVLLQDESK